MDENKDEVKDVEDSVKPEDDTNSEDVEGEGDEDKGGEPAVA